MGVQFGKWSERPEKPRENLGRLLDNRVQYEVRAYVYQARDLPPSDDGGLARCVAGLASPARKGADDGTWQHVRHGEPGGAVGAPGVHAAGALQGV